MAKRFLILIPVILSLLAPALAQDERAGGCAVEELTRQQETFARYLTLDFLNDRDMALANLFRLGALYQSLALGCGYQPNLAEVNVMLEQTLDYASLDDLIAAQSVGDDVQEILIELETVYGDPLTGQLLYNGLGAGAGRHAAGLRGLPRKRGNCAPDSRYLDAHQRCSTAPAAIRRL